MAPEYLNTKRIHERNEKGDVFSFGVIAWELVTREKPWCNYNPLDIVLSVINDRKTLDIPDTCPKCIQELLLKCWKYGLNIPTLK